MGGEGPRAVRAGESARPSGRDAAQVLVAAPPGDAPASGGAWLTVRGARRAVLGAARGARRAPAARSLPLWAADEPPRVAALYVPWFGAAAARRREPALADVPLVLLAPRQGGWRVAALSAEAAAAGVRLEMKLAQAESCCAGLAWRPLDAAYLATEAARVLLALEAHVVVEPAGEAAGGVGALFRPRALAHLAPLAPVPGAGEEAAEIARGAPGRLGMAVERQALARLLGLLREATGYQAAAGVAEGRGVATIAARRAAVGEVEQVRAGASAAYLAPLPLALLPVSGEMRRRLALFGLATIGALAALPLGPVQAQFGPEGRLAWAIANGRDTRPLVPREPPGLPVVEWALEAPCADRALLLRLAERLLDRALAEVPGGKGVGQVALRLTLEGTLGEAPPVWEQALAPAQPTRDAATLRRLLASALLRAALPAAVTELRLELGGLAVPPPLQPALLPDRRGQVALALAAATRGLQARCGGNPLRRVLPLDPAHRLPERRYALIV